MQFRYSLFFVVLLFSLCLGSLFFYLGTYDSADRIIYHQLLQGEEEEGEDVAGFSSKQHRTKMQKDLFFTEKGKRLQMHLESENADLVLDFHPQQEIVEHMQGVICYVQEDLFDFISKEGRSESMQQVLYFESPSAVYHYSNKIFVAENVKVFRYVVPGHDLYDPHLDSDAYFLPSGKNNDHLISHGEAKSIEFSLEDDHFNFKANGLRATLYDFKGGR